MLRKTKILTSSIAIVSGIACFTPAITLTLTSCSNTKEYSINKSLAKQIYTDYNNELNNVFNGQAYYQLTAENQPKVVNIIEKYLNITNNSLTKLEATATQTNLDPIIWLKSVQFELQTKLKLIQSNIRYLIVNSNEVMTMTNYNESFQRTILNVATTYNQNTTIDSKINDFKNVTLYINQVLTNLKEGLANGVTWSGVMAKHTIGNILQKLYNDVLESATSDTAILNSLNNGNINGKLFLDNASFNDWKSNKNITDDFTKAQTNAQNTIDSLINFLISEYYPGINYGSSSGSLNFVVTTNSPNEEDNGFYSQTNKKYISGLGLNNSDLNTNDIGIGYSGETGQKIYNALLQKHTNITNVLTTDQFALGNSQVNDIKTAMTNVANYIADLKTGSSATNKEWKETYMYDQDSSENQYGSIKKENVVIRNSSGQINLTNFFQWLNSDQFFNGRDMTENQFPTIDGTTALNNWVRTGTADTNGKTTYKYTPYPLNVESGSDSDYVKKVIGFIGDTNAENTITWGDAGNLYVKYVNQGLSPATIQTSNNIKFTDASQNNVISPAAAYIGASNAVSQYLLYKDNTAQNFSKAFKNTSVDYTLRTGTGGAAYASSGAGGTSWVDEAWGGFYLDVNPYFGLQKWSMSTLANHEGVTGHVFQFNYALENPADSDTVRVSSTAYSEGWGLFSEWLAVQFGTYGSPKKLNIILDTDSSINMNETNLLELPSFGTESKTNNITNLENYANNVYKLNKTESNANTTSENGSIDQVSNTNSQSYYDALQYFGFLNERQLRAMRITVDVGLHAGQNGNYTKGQGWSLKKARDYLSSNSGLGIDDIKRETKRYLEYTGQATSYYNGLLEMTNYFLKAQKAYEDNNTDKTFMDWTNLEATNANTAPIFDLILRNGTQALEALTWGVNFYLDNLYKTNN